MGALKKQPPSASKFFSLFSLNTHFTSVTNRHLPLTLSDLHEILEAPNLNGTPFFFTVVSDTQVISALKSTYSNSCGPDHISSSILKLCAPSILPYLTALINAYFSSSTFPSSWKNSHIHALLKSITPSSPSDTRRIAQLPEMAKIQERIAFEQLLAHLESQNHFTRCQACYRKCHST